MAERQWAEAATDFFEAFKNYDEAGNHRRIQCLKYVCSSSCVCIICIGCVCIYLFLLAFPLSSCEGYKQFLTDH